MPDKEVHVCIGCGRHTTTHPSQICSHCVNYEGDFDYEGPLPCCECGAPVQQSISIVSRARNSEPILCNGCRLN